MVSKLTTRLFYAAEGLLLAGVFATCVVIYRPEEWQPPLLVGLLLLLSLGGQRLVFMIRGQHLSAGLVAQVLAMALLGPVPAVAVSIAAAIFISFGRKLPPSAWLNNLTTFAVFPMAGGLLGLALIGNVHDPAGQTATGIAFALAVFAIYFLSLILDFGAIAQPR